MSESRSLSPWWALLLLPVAMLVGWFAGGLQLPSRSSEPSTRNATLLREPIVPVPAQPAPVGAMQDGGPTIGLGRPETDAPGDDDAVYSTWTTFDVATKQARSNGKPILLDFNAEWCGPCQALKREVFDHAAAGTTVKAAVIPVSLVDRTREDGSNSAQVAELQQRFKVEVFPTLVVYSPATGRAVRLEGYPGANEALRWITDTAAAVK